MWKMDEFPQRLRSFDIHGCGAVRMSHSKPYALGIPSTHVSHARSYQDIVTIVVNILTAAQNKNQQHLLENELRYLTSARLAMLPYHGRHTNKPGSIELCIGRVQTERSNS